MKSILLLQDPHASEHVVDVLVPTWRHLGYRVIRHAGLRDLPRADLLFLHVDRSVLPEAYAALAADYPVTVNGRALDISRHRYSMARLAPGDAYDGPVIIKTDANYGGLPEHGRRTARRPAWSRLAGHLAQLRAGARPPRSAPETDWATLDHLNPHRYPILANLGEVPAGVWENPHLIVERFLPEREGEFYFVRYWSFLGDREMAGRYGSRHPIVKFGGIATPDTPVAPPAELRQWRQRLGLDYGRLDYVMHDGQPVLLDANKTPGGGDSLPAYQSRFDALATGIASFLP